MISSYHLRDLLEHFALPPCVCCLRSLTVSNLHWSNGCCVPLRAGCDLFTAHVLMLPATHSLSETSYTVAAALKNVCLPVAQTFKLACTVTRPPTHSSEKSTIQPYGLMYVDFMSATSCCLYKPGSITKLGYNC